jgi:teichuronic acid biosynthesis glycosyltransferase TuaG
LEVNNEPLISIIIPLYNADKYIAETVQSVISQIYTNWELIVVDDCSVDNSIKIVEKFERQDARIKIIKSEVNFGGPARPRNIGMENAKGEYIAFLDADDLWMKDKLKYQINLMIKKQYNFTSTNTISINEISENIKSSIFLKLLNKMKRKSNICDLIKYSFIATSSVIVRKDKVRLFSENKEMISVEDFVCWLELMQNNVKFNYIDRPLIKYRVLINSISDRQVPDKQYVKANICVLKHILKYNSYILVRCFYLKLIRDFVNKLIRK